MMNCRSIQILLCLQSAWTGVVTQSYPCLEAVDDKCHSSSSANTTDSRGVVHGSEAASFTEGSCKFDGTLCSYRQECTDNVNLNWQLNAGYVQLTGQNGCDSVYSVLESPVLNINRLSCLSLTFSRDSPSQLAVYLTNRTSVVTVLPQTNASYPSSNSVHYFQKTVQSGQSKLRFRGYSGGGSAGNVRIYAVSVRPGGCEDPACRFEDDFCGWENVNWKISSGAPGEGMAASLRGDASNGHLQSRLARSTECQLDCLNFIFKMSGTHDILSVSLIRSSGQKLLVWTVTSSGTTSTTWNHATIPVRIGEAYQVFFEATREISKESELGIDRVRYVRYTMGLGECSFLPGYATMGSYTINSACDIVTDSSITPQPPIKTTDTSFVRSTAIVTTSGANMSLHENQSGMSAPEDTSNITTIAASVAGGVVFIAVIISCVLVWRRRRQQRKSRKANDSSNDGAAVTTTRKDKMEPSRETAAATDIASATETHYDGLGELSPQSHYTSLVGTKPASEAAASYYNIVSDGSTQQGRREPHTTWSAETPYESLGEPIPPSVYTSLQNTAAASDTRTYYSNDFAQNNGSYYSVTPGNSA